jgi:hypothetical protein
MRNPKQEIAQESCWQCQVINSKVESKQFYFLARSYLDCYNDTSGWYFNDYHIQFHQLTNEATKF